MSKSIAMVVLVQGAMLFAIMLTGCSDDPAPMATPTTAPTSTPQPTATLPLAPTITPTPEPAATATMAPTNNPTPVPTSTQTPVPTNTPTPVPTSTQTPVPTAMPTAAPTAAIVATTSLDEYLAKLDCASYDEGPEPETYGDFSAFIQEAIDEVSALVPPAELAEWHHASLTGLEKFKVSIDAFPLENEIDFLAILALAESSEAEEAKIQEIVEGLPDDVRQRLIEAGCTDESATSDDHGDDIDSATAVAVGEVIEGSLDGGDDRDAFVFQAEAGQEYMAELSYLVFFIAFGTKTGPLITIYDSSGQEVARIEEDSVRKAVEWTAEDTGNHYVVLGDGASSGSYSLTVSPVAAPVSIPASTPTPEPTATHTPTPDPTDAPTREPTAASTSAPTAAPAPTPTTAPAPAPTATPAPFKIGVMESVTGPGETYGNVAVQAKEMAVDEINAAGGINGRMLELVVEDSKCNAQDSITAYNKLTDVDGVKIILGSSCSGAMLGAAPLAEEEGVVLFSGLATNPDIAEAGDYIFRTSMSDAQLGIDSGNVLWADGIRTLATITESTDYAEGVRRESVAQFEKRGGEVVAEERYPSDTTDFRTYLTRLLNENPDAIHLAAQGEFSGGTIVKQLRELGYDGPLYSEVMPVGATALEIAGDAATGLKAIVAELDPANVKAQEVLGQLQGTLWVRTAVVVPGLGLR